MRLTPLTAAASALAALLLSGCNGRSIPMAAGTGVPTPTVTSSETTGPGAGGVRTKPASAPSGPSAASARTTTPPTAATTTPRLPAGAFWLASYGASNAQMAALMTDVGLATDHNGCVWLTHDGT